MWSWYCGQTLEKQLAATSSWVSDLKIQAARCTQCPQNSPTLFAEASIVQQELSQQGEGKENKEEHPVIGSTFVSELRQKDLKFWHGTESIIEMERKSRSS